MKDIFRRAAARALGFANSKISEDGELDIPIHARLKHLDISIPKAHLSRIFHTNSSAYAETSTQVSIEIRDLAGLPGFSTRMAEHGVGATRAWRSQPAGMNVYVNEKTNGVGRNMMRAVRDIIGALPTVIIHARTPNAFLEKAKGLAGVAHECEQGIVGRYASRAANPMQPIFTISAKHTDHQDDDNVTLQEIRLPVLDQDGRVEGLRRINPKAPDAGIQTLRALIFFKLLMDQMSEKDPADVATCLQAAQALPLDKTSKLQDYLTYQIAKPKPQAALP